MVYLGESVSIVWLTHRQLKGILVSVTKGFMSQFWGMDQRSAQLALPCVALVLEGVVPSVWTAGIHIWRRKQMEAVGALKGSISQELVVSIVMGPVRPAQELEHRPASAARSSVEGLCLDLSVANATLLVRLALGGPPMSVSAVTLLPTGASKGLDASSHALQPISMLTAKMYARTAQSSVRSALTSPEPA